MQTEIAAAKKGKELLFGADWLRDAGQSDGEDILNSQVTPWKVMIIDDDDEVHQVSIMVLADYTFEGRPVEIIQGYSGAACRNLMKKHPDTAVLLLDVVMESDSAGLDAARYVREELNNYKVRIIIRTGQPGQAPEQHVMTSYDINGYVEKSDLTAQKLYSCLTVSLRAYRDITQQREQ